MTGVMVPKWWVSGAEVTPMLVTWAEMKKKSCEFSAMSYPSSSVRERVPFDFSLFHNN